ncbi:transmembrane protein 234 [Polypterus senegalus]|uniref:transmembrane protein 234 n=1 Tax=Polypterus senegalus TaxID=55291 RepID=UPI0019622FFF|nr:transmembrane protein 234 [Polypterus senegalus]
MVTEYEVISLLLVALLWGGTNPFLKKGTRGIEQVQKSNPIIQLLAEIKFLFLNYNYLVPFFLNQCGSIIYYYTLATTELSLAVTMSNSLTFLFTLLTGKLLGEEIGGKRAVLGILMVALGITLCVGNSGNTEQSQHG